MDNVEEQMQRTRILLKFLQPSLEMLISRFEMGSLKSSLQGALLITLQKLEKKFEHPGCIQVYLLLQHIIQYAIS